MSINEVQALLAEVEQRTGSAAGQLGAVRSEVEEVTELLVHVSQGSTAPEAGDALGALRSVSTELGRAVHDALVASETVREYDGRL